MKNKAPIGIEPMHKGFADLSLTSWVRRQMRGTYYLSAPVFVNNRQLLAGAGALALVSLDRLASFFSLMFSHIRTNALAM